MDKVNYSSLLNVYRATLDIVVISNSSDRICNMGPIYYKALDILATISGKVE